MKYQIVGGAGLHRKAKPKHAFDMMVKQFYQIVGLAMLVLVVTDSQRSMEIDMLIITADRLLLVEL